MKKSLFYRYNEIRADILEKLTLQTWGILSIIGIFLGVINLFVGQNEILFGLSQGFILSAVIVPLMKLIFYFPKIRRLLGAMEEEIK